MNSIVLFEFCFILHFSNVVNIWFEEKSKHPFFIQLLCLVNKIPTKFHLEIKISLESGDENLVQESR